MCEMLVMMMMMLILMMMITIMMLAMGMTMMMTTVLAGPIIGPKPQRCCLYREFEAKALAAETAESVHSTADDKDASKEVRRVGLGKWLCVWGLCFFGN